MNSNEKRNIMIDHYNNPRNRGLIDSDEYKMANTNNESCIDDINIQLKVVDDTIEDIRFDGEACAICISSASVMTDILKGKNINSVIKVLKNYENMIDGKDYDEKVLDISIIYSDIKKQPNRKKCALLPWWALDKILKEMHDK